LHFDASTLVAQSLLAEWVPVTWRGFLLVLINGMWNMGRFGITVLWAFLTPVDHWPAFFFAAATIPTMLALFVLIWGQHYESPRFFAVIGDAEKCIDALRLAASSTSAENQDLPSGWDDPACLQLDSDSGEAVNVTPRAQLSQLAELREPKLRCLTATLGFCFFTVSFSWSALFYWLIEYFMVLGIEGAIVPVMLAAPVGKVTSVAVLLAPYVPGKCFVDRWPRALIMKIGYFGAGACVGSLCLTTNVIALTIIMFCSQIFEGFIWEMGTIYVTEAFPTTVRSGATGMTYMLGSLGGILSAAIVGELMEIWVYLPMVTSAALLISGGLACFLLTEERGRSPLIDTMGYGSCDAKTP
jgi:MFS family permease